MAYIQPRNITANIVKKQVIRVEKLVGERNKFRDVAFKKQRLFAERGRLAEAERKVEAPQDGKEKEVSSRIPIPKLGFLDVIKNFLFKVLFGVFAVKLLPYLPKLKGVFVASLKFGEFILKFSGMIINAFATFIDKAYQIVDFGKQQAKMLGGDKGLKNYEKTLNLANKVINSMLIAGMLFSDLVESDARGGAAQDAVDIIKDRVVQQAGQRAAQQAAIRGAAQLSTRAAAGVVASVGLISSALGEGMFQLRKFTTKIEKDAYDGLAEAQKDPNPFMRFLKVGFYNTIAIPGLRFYNFVSTGIGTLLDIIGAPFRYAIELINFGIMSLTGDAEGIKQQRQNLGKLDARIREQIRQIVNTLSFGMLAKQQGSFGSLFGDQAVKSMGYASGGAVTRGGVYQEAVTRTVGKKEKAKRSVEVPTSPLQPGSDVSGLTPYKNSDFSRIEAFYPNPEGSGTVNPYSYLKKSYDIVAKTKFIHPLLEISIKTLFGDKPSESDFKAVGFGINNFFNDILDTTKVPGKNISVSDEVGPVDISKWVSDNTKQSMMGSINSILSDLMKQLTLKRGLSGEGKASPSAQKGPEAGDNPLSQFGGQAQFVIGDSIARGFAGLGSTPGTDADDSKVGRRPEDVLTILKARGNKLKGTLIDLSTGIANDVSEWSVVEQELSYLKSLGARVRVLGVGNTYSKENGGINEKLSQLVSKYGFYFYGGYKGSADGLHGSVTDYNELRAKLKRDTTATPGGSTTSLIPSGGLKGLTDADWNELAYIVSGEAGPGDDRYGVAAVVLNRVASPAWPNSISAVGRQGGQFEAVYKGLARYDKKIADDLKANQGKIVSALTRLNGRDSFKGTSEYANMGPGDIKFDSRGNFYHYSSQRSKNSPPPTNPDQSWRKWILAAQHGGYIDKTQMVLTHPGEYVVDADSVRLFGIDFYDIINKTETISQRRRASDNLISILSQYTEDGFPETEDDNTYYVPEKSNVHIIPPQIMVLPNVSNSFGGSGDDPSMDGLYM